MGKNLVLTAEVYPIVHIDNCPNKEKADLALTELDNYQTLMYNNFAPAKTDEDRNKYFKEVVQAKFWTENMLKGIKPGECDDCDKIIMKYIYEPLNTIRIVQLKNKNIEYKIMTYLDILRQFISPLHRDHIEQIYHELSKLVTE